MQKGERQAPLPKYLHVQCRIHKVYILLIQLFPKQLYRLAEALEMHDLPFPQKLNDIVHIRVVRKPNLSTVYGGIVTFHTLMSFRCVNKKLSFLSGRIVHAMKSSCFSHAAFLERGVGEIVLWLQRTVSPTIHMIYGSNARFTA